MRIGQSTTIVRQVDVARGSLQTIRRFVKMDGVNASDPETVLTKRCLDRPSGLYTVATTLRHFAIITYAIRPEQLRAHLPREFPPHLVKIDGEERVLVSVVPFLDRDFHFIRFPFANWSFGQTNYRIYVSHRGEECAWFLGTSLATPLVQVPRQLWQLPWLPATTRFDAYFDDRSGRYQKYVVETTGPAAAEIELQDLGGAPGLLPGFDRFAEQELVIHHPTRGYFRRRMAGLAPTASGTTAFGRASERSFTRAISSWRIWVF